MEVDGRRYKTPDSWKVVAALDFGTTYSGYAYCIRPENGKKPEIVTNPPWNTGAADIAFPKTPTTILFNSRKEFCAFGFEAEKRYAKLVLRDQHMDWFYFTRFKMSLYSEYGKLRRLNRFYQIEDVNGKRGIAAMTVFSEATKYLKERLEATLADNGHDVEKDRIRWVLTVPAIWDNAAKQFMRESAEKAGIPSDQLMLALEPEAATLFVLTLSKLEDGVILPLLQKRTKFVNLDLGGGTADVTVHEVHGDGTVTELYRPTGGYWGGTQVDNSFDKLLYRFVGQNSYTSWKTKYPADYLDLKNDFEASKRSFSGEEDDDVTIRIPHSLADMVKGKTSHAMDKSSDQRYEVEPSSITLEKVIEQSYKDGSIIFSQGRLTVTGSMFKELFRVSIEGVLAHLNTLLRQVTGVNTLVLVGAFSQSTVVKNAIKKTFGNLKLVIPDQPGLTVLRGATLFGLNKEAVVHRVSPYTYGVSLFRPYQDGDPEKYVSYGNGEKMTGQTFDIHIKAGERLEIGKYSVKRNYTQVNLKSGVIILFLYRSTEREPKFVTDGGCVGQGDLEIKVPRGIAADVEVEFRYLETEIVVSATDKNTGEQYIAKLDTLEKD